MFFKQQEIINLITQICPYIIERKIKIWGGHAPQLPLHNMWVHSCDLLYLHYIEAYPSSLPIFYLGCLKSGFLFSFVSSFVFLFSITFLFSFLNFQLLLGFDKSNWLALISHKSTSQKRNNKFLFFFIVPFSYAHICQIAC